jgi:hypothetical protein
VVDEARLIEEACPATDTILDPLGVSKKVTGQPMCRVMKRVCDPVCQQCNDLVNQCQSLTLSGACNAFLQVAIWAAAGTGWTFLCAGVVAAYEQEAERNNYCPTAHQPKVQQSGASGALTIIWAAGATPSMGYEEVTLYAAPKAGYVRATYTRCGVFSAPLARLHINPNPH